MDAIEELMMTDNPKKNKLVGLLKKLPDIEKGVCRIHYGKVNDGLYVGQKEVLIPFYIVIPN